jgi:hypothetical protein
VVVLAAVVVVFVGEVTTAVVGVVDVKALNCVVVEVNWIAVVVLGVVVVALLQAENITAVTSSIDATTTSHFLLNLFNNYLFSFLLFPSL